MSFPIISKRNKLLLPYKACTTYIVRFLLHNWQVFLFDLTRPISIVTFCCTGTITAHVILMQSTISQYFSYLAL